MKVLFRAIRAPGRLLALNTLARQEIERVLDNEVKPALVKSHEAIVADWEHQPGFASRKYVRPDSIAVSVYPTGENADIWIWVDRGTKPHEIPERVPKAALALRFQAGGKYQPKTLAAPARTVSGGGRVTGGTTVFAQRAKAFTHPGTEAREFTKVIAEDISPEFKRVVENAFRRVAREVAKG
jgi:hypothetical protein